MSTPLTKYFATLATDPSKLESFLDDIDSAMHSAEMEADAVDAVKSRDLYRITARLVSGDVSASLPAGAVHITIHVTAPPATITTTFIPPSPPPPEHIPQPVFPDPTPLPIPPPPPFTPDPTPPPEHENEDD